MFLYRRFWSDACLKKHCESEGHDEDEQIDCATDAIEKKNLDKVTYT